MAMVKVPFNGQLNSNEIFGVVYNMIISQQVFSDNVKGVYDALVNKVKVDGTLYGDTKLYYATDVLESKDWLNDAEANNLLAINRPDAPKCQAITLDQFRIITTTLDNYLTKRAWSTEGAFSDFNSVVLAQVRVTKRVYEATLVNSYMGTITGEANKATKTINLDSASAGDPLYGLNVLEASKQEAMIIAQNMADLFVEMKDVSRDFNDYKFLRSYELSDLFVVWNSAWVNKIRKVDLPTIFHNDGLVDKFEEYILPERYFGTTITSTNISDYAAAGGAEGKPFNSSSNKAYTPGAANANGKVCSLIETTLTVDDEVYHLFAGDELPVGTKVSTSASADTMAYGTIYIVDSKIIAKVFHNDTVKMMDAFEVGTSFFNPRSLTENHYLIWGYSKPDYLRDHPLVKIVKK